jgi:uracil-DNA glycosylase
MMILAQDWASEDFLAKPFNEENANLGHDPSLPTNIRLFNLLENFFRISFADTYATNAFVFIKPGKMSAGIPAVDFALSTIEYALPQIEIIGPKLVICLGSKPYNALRRTQKLPRKSLQTALREKVFTVGTSAVVGVHHTGGLGMAQIGGQQAQEKQWQELADYFSASLKNR